MLPSIISIFTLFFLFSHAKAFPLNIPKAEPETANLFQFFASVAKTINAVQQIHWSLTIITICVLLVLATSYSLWYCDWYQRREKEKIVRNLSKRQMAAILLRTLRLK
ncbi:hypothetical protein XENTR_v10017256 [Xenopus tropicalis]|nr:hypothetical protein XENTR_v10017256 [Xenopus tropicalis]